MGLATLFGATPQGFFAPYRHAAASAPIAYPLVEAAFRDHDAAMRAVLAAIDRHADRLRGFRGPPPAPRFDQDWFAGLDAAAAYALVLERKVEAIVEIGSGHSSRFLARALEDLHGEGGAARLLCIDPEPRASLAGLGVRLILSLLDDESEKEARALLERGAALFVDSSHLALPGLDVDRIFTRLAPALAPGALLHVHDVFLPDPYPDHWAWRSYSEQGLVASLIAHGAFRPVFASHWAASRLGAASPAPLIDGAMQTSLWLERR